MGAVQADDDGPGLKRRCSDPPDDVTISIMRLSFMLLMAFIWTEAVAHGGMPRSTGLHVSSTHPDTTWILTNNQGILADLKDGFRWLCEDAIAPSAGVRGLRLTGLDGARWLVATTQGLFESQNGGCDFQRASGEVGSHSLAGLWSTSDGRLLTGSSSMDVYNDVLLSDDDGVTWRSAGLRMQGRTLDLQVSGVPGGAMYLHTTQAIYRSRDQGESFDLITVQLANNIVPPDQVFAIAPSPTLQGLVLLAISSGSRTRIVRSQDHGERWEVVQVIEAPAAQLAFNSDGTEVLAYGLSGLAWRSIDSGRTWREAAPVPPTLGCLKHDADGVLWACANPYQGGPWVLGWSADFGRSWRSVLERMEDAEERWDCGPEAHATLCCRGLCPGEQAAAACGQPNPQTPPALCEPGEGVMLTSRSDGGVDASDPSSKSTDATAAPAEPHQSSSVGCAVASGPWSSGSALLLGFLTLFLGLLRRA